MFKTSINSDKTRFIVIRIGREIGLILGKRLTAINTQIQTLTKPDVGLLGIMPIYCYIFQYCSLSQIKYIVKTNR